MRLTLLLVGAAGCGSTDSMAVGSTTQNLETDESTIQSMNYFRCANEGGTCAIGGSRYMAFGSGSRFVFALKSGNVPCNTATFGANSTTNKACYFSNYGGNFPGSTPIATQNQSTTAFGNVAYGANGMFRFKTFRGSFTCNNSTFGGDPIPGTTKACYLALPAYTLAAREGEYLNGLYNTPVAYGANGKFIFSVVAGSVRVQCSAATFGDPGSGATNDCYRLDDGHRGTVPAAYLADEGQTWQTMVRGPTVEFYGSGRNGNILSTNVSGNTGPCSNAIGNPDSTGAIKHCWGAPSAPNRGTWSRVTATFPCSDPDPNRWCGPGEFQLLMDGSILANDTSRPEAWYRFRPDPVNGYAGGSWSGTSISHYKHTSFATGLLNDGRFVIAGGEYVTDVATNTDVDTNRCEIFDPIAQSWSDLPDFAVFVVSGGTIAPLPDGRLVVGAGPGQSMIFDPSVCPRGQACISSPWSDLEWNTNRPDGFAFGEGSITHLQNGNVFAAENRAGKFLLSAPEGSRWSTIPAWPSPPPAVWDEAQFPGLHHGEAGPVLTLYDGRVLITAVTGYNAIYDPSNDNITAAAATPGLIASHENTQTVMPNGNVLLAVTRDFYAFKFYEYDVPSNTFSDVSLGAPDFSSRQGDLMQTPLPDGTIFVASTAFREAYIYHPAGSAPAQYPRPNITSITGPDASGVYTLSGTSLNGLTNGANRDDEGHPYTSFPIVALTRANSSSTWYADVRSISTMSIHPGDAVVAKFVIPSVVPRGTLTVKVSASGLKSSNSRTITF